MNRNPSPKDFCLIVLYNVDSVSMNRYAKRYREIQVSMKSYKRTRGMKDLTKEKSKKSSLEINLNRILTVAYRVAK
jgi:uncharacterized membrane protein (DUF106 family)